jgi:beta-glucosidase
MTNTSKALSVLCLVCLSLVAAGQSGGQSAGSAQGDADQRAEKILSQMTLEEKIDYVGGYDDFYIRAIPRLGVPALKMSDGPLGVRNYGPDTYYPAGINMAATWDPELEHRIGMEMGMDARARGVHFILGPGMNIYRAPMCGRNFEYFGEDPFLASRMAVAVITGIQSQGVIATAKHFMGNNQEWNRHNTSSDIDERTMREIYMPAFEASVKEGHVGAIMVAYNLVNGTHMTQNAYLMNEVVKKEWGFKGIIMSDWDATYDGVAAANAGLDLEMPSAKFMDQEVLIPAVKEGRVSQATIDDKVRRILRTAIEFGFFDRPQTDSSASLLNEEARKVALEGALGGMVLLKNDSILPLDPSKLKSLAVIGPRAYPGVPEGGGSAYVDPLLSVSLVEGISNRLLGSGTKVFYTSGVPESDEVFGQDSFTTTPDGKQVGLTGEYFNNPNLEGAPALVRTDAHVFFDWGRGSYLEGGPRDNFSVRWTGYFTPKSSGLQIFYVGGEGGARLFVDGKLELDQWNSEDTNLQEVPLSLKAGEPHKIRFEYHKDSGGATIGFGVIPGKNPAVVQAGEIAAKADAVVLCVGLNSDSEGEGRDRSFALPPAQEALIQAVLGTNKNVVVVLTAGGNVDMSGWIDSVPALLDAWYPGQEGGTALAKILFGDVSPSGKLPASFERRWEDSAAFNSYYDKNGSKQVAYTEGVFLGYRHFDKAGIKPLFPFGYGLSYTTFRYSNLKTAPASFQGDGPVTVSFDLTNTGTREGAEVAEVYVSDNHSKVARPLKELKGFSKVNLKPGETKNVTVSLNRRAFSYYDVSRKQWTAEPGDFGILVGGSSAIVELTGKVTLKQ